MRLMRHDWARLGDAITARRKAIGWNQEKLADVANVGRTTVQNLEGAREYSRIPTSAFTIEQALGWPPGTVRGILAGGDPPVTVDTPEPEVEVSPEPEALTPRTLMAGIPLRVAEELMTGEAVDTVVLNLSGDGSGMRLVAVLKADDAAKVDPETYRRTLEEWVQAQRRLHGLPTNGSASEAADGA
jgi:transcriptional regulator with XRE-family HTH domain